MEPQTLIKCATNSKHKNIPFDKKEPTKNLNTITYLSLDNRGIYHVENMQYCTSISVLYLSENFISSLHSAFTGHTYKNLVQLALDNNRIQRIEGLDNLTSLKRLYLEKNCISKLEGLSNCKQLEELYLSK